MRTSWESRPPLDLSSKLQIVNAAYRYSRIALGVALLSLAIAISSVAVADLSPETLQAEVGTPPTLSFKRLLASLHTPDKSPLDLLTKDLDGLVVVVRVTDCNGAYQYTARGQLTPEIAKQHGVEPTDAWVHSITLRGLIGQMETYFTPTGIVKKVLDMRDATVECCVLYPCCMGGFGMFAVM